MKLIVRNLILFFSMVLLIGNTQVSASQPPTPISDTTFTQNTISNLFPFNSYTKNSSGKLLQVNAGLKLSFLGLAQMSTRVILSNKSNYVKINMQLQRYKSGSWKTVTSGTQSGKGLSSYSWRYYVSKGYKYRVKNYIYLYKSKNGTLLDKDTCYSNVLKK